MLLFNSGVAFSLPVYNIVKGMLLNFHVLLALFAVMIIIVGLLFVCFFTSYIFVISCYFFSFVFPVISYHCYSSHIDSRLHTMCLGCRPEKSAQA